MARPFVNELQEGDALSGVYAVTSKSLRPFRDAAKGNFLALTLTDRTGSIQAKVWDRADEVAEGFEEGDVVRVEGRLETYHGALQGTASLVTRLAAEEYDATDFVPESPWDPHDMLASVTRAVDENVKQPQLRTLLDAFLANDDVTPKLLRAPAAKSRHHACIGGLIEHIASSLVIASGVYRVHKGLDRALLCAGIVLHDIGKMRELEVKATIDYTVEGRLIGHITLGYEWVTTLARSIEGFPEDTRLQLGHIILSHHGRTEHGSPIVPMTPEAVAVHFIENTDAQAHHALALVERARAEAKPFTEYDRLLERYFYAGRHDDPEAD